MSRLIARCKLGYFPIDRGALAAALSWITPPEEPGACTLLDPCCGQGAALAQLREYLGLPAGNCCGVELDEGRTRDARKANPGAVILGPAAYESCRITAHSFSMIYLNPPFADEMGGGGRIEAQFLYRAVSQLRPGGVLLMVLPQQAWHRDESMREEMDCYFKDGREFAFPSQYRKYREVFVIATRRRTACKAEDNPTFSPRYSPNYSRYYPTYVPIDEIAVRPEDRYRLTPAPGPKQFLKTAYTEMELVREVDSSRLNRLLDDPRPAPKMRPPLALGQGHLGLLLSAGQLDGLVCPPGEPPHVVRGSVRKEPVVKDVELSVAENGTVTEKKTVAERIVRVVRTVDTRGVFRELEG